MKGKSGGSGCFPPEGTPLSCDSDSECDEAEVCVYFEKSKICLSKVLANQMGLNDKPQDGPGLTFDDCKEDLDCKGSRECINAGPKLTDDEDETVCKPTSTTSCEKDDECEETGESCVKFDGRKSCISERAIEKYNIDCVAADHLTEAGIDADQRIHVRDLLANVLCDYNDSCATPGHMVLYKGRGMMMRSYCEVVGCYRGIMRVNSPKYGRQIRVRSRSEEMVFTAFAARWVTAAEERVLHGLIRLGL